MTGIKNGRLLRLLTASRGSRQAVILPAKVTTRTTAQAVCVVLRLWDLSLALVLNRPEITISIRPIP